MITLLSLVFIAISSTYIHSADQEEFNKSLFIEHPLVNVHNLCVVPPDTHASQYHDAFSKFQSQDHDFSTLPPEQLQIIRACSVTHFIRAYQKEIALMNSFSIWSQFFTCEYNGSMPIEEHKNMEKNLMSLLEETSLSKYYCNYPTVLIDPSPEDMLKKEDLDSIVLIINKNIQKAKMAEEEKKPGVTTKPAKK